MSILRPSAASNGRTLLRAGPLQSLQDVLDLGTAHDPTVEEAARVVLRPLELLDRMWAEVDGVLANHPPAIERLRVTLASAAGWRRWLLQQLSSDSDLGPVVAAASGRFTDAEELIAHRVPGLVDEGALAILCQATLVVASRSDFSTVLVTPLALALSAGPAEALARVADDLTDPSAVPTLLRGLDLAGSPPLPDAMRALLTSPAELARWALLTALLALLRGWEQEDRNAFAVTRWEGATADGIRGVELGTDGSVLLRGIDELETGALGVTFAPPPPPQRCPGTPVLEADGVRVALPEGFRDGWVGLELPSLMGATNEYRAHVRDRWSAQGAAVAVFASVSHSLGSVANAALSALLDVPVELLADLVSPAAPPRTATNTLTVGPVLRWVDLQPVAPGPGETVVVTWRAAGATVVRVRHRGEEWSRKASGSLSFPAATLGTHVVELVAREGAAESTPVQRSYTVDVQPQLTATARPHRAGEPVVVELMVEPAGAARVEAQIDGVTHGVDLDGSGELVLPATTPDGALTLTLLDPDDGVLWGQDVVQVVTLAPQARRLVVVRCGVLDDGQFQHGSLDPLLAATTQAGLDVEVVELPVLPDDLATLLEVPLDAEDLLDALHRQSVVSPGGEDAWWVAWLPGEQGLLGARASSVTRGLVVADAGSADGLAKLLSATPRPMGHTARWLRVTGWLGEGAEVQEVREELRSLPLPHRSERALEKTVAVTIPSDIQWVLLDAQQRVLTEHPMPAVRGPFAMLIPRPAAAVRLQLRWVGLPASTPKLFDRGRPQSAPEIQFEAWEGDEVRFAYQHPQHRGAQLSLELSRGGVWVHAATLAPCGGAAVDPADFGPADHARVVAVDGWNGATSDALPSPTTGVGGAIRVLADGTLATDFAGAFRWRIDGVVSSEAAVLVPPSQGRVELELGPVAAPTGTVVWSPA